MKTLALSLALLMPGALAQSVFPPVSGGGGGGGASATFQLTDAKIVQASTTLTVAGTCSASAPCNTRYGPVVSPAVITLVSGTGTVFVDVTSGPTLNVWAPASGLSVTCDAHCTVSTGTTHPNGSVQVATWSATSGAWASTGTDNRVFLDGAGITQVVGSGSVTCTQTGSVVTCSATGGSGPFPVYRDIPFADQDSGNCVRSSGIKVSTTSTINLTGGCAFVFSSTGDTAEFAYFLPSTWNGGAISLTLEWLNSVGGSGNVELKVSAFCIGGSNAVNGTYGTPTVPAGFAIPAIGLATYSTITVPITGCATSNLIRIKVGNTASGSGGTTYTSNIAVIGASLAVTQ
jgi:hypothetical protein